MEDRFGHSITYRAAVGPQAGQKVFTLQTVPQRDEEPRTGVAQYAGFSLHAGLSIETEQRAKLERLARYVSRPAVSVERLALTPPGRGQGAHRHAAERATPRHVAMSWAQRLKPVFAIDLAHCRRPAGGSR